MDKEMPRADLLKRRVRLTFDFDITCNDGPILNSINEDKAYDIALLKSFLKAGEQKLLHINTVKIN